MIDDETRLKFLQGWQDVLTNDELYEMRVLDYMVRTKRIGKEGAGWIRLIVGPGPTVEYCYICGCQKSGWVNMENPVRADCPDTVCLCHTAERIQ